MFGKKKEKIVPITDTMLLAECMDKAIAGDFSLADPEAFQDKELAAKYNQLITNVLHLNNNLVMRLNDSMTYIGDSGCVKDMIEQLNEQTVAINDMHGSSRDLEDSIQNIQNAVQNIQKQTHTVMKETRSCVEDMNSSIHTVDASAASVLQINDQVVDFQTKAAKINEIIDMVKKVANKSGLLALNASIEAARAGESGKGFAVVANQIKELSANTTQSAESAMAYVSELMEGISSLAESINSTATQLTSGNESVHHSVQGLEQMNENLNSISIEIDSIYEEINTQSSLTGTFVSSIDTIAKSYDDLSQGCVGTGNHMYKISRIIDNLRSDMARHRAKLPTQDWITVYAVDHLIFTWRLYNNLADFEHLKITQLNNPTGCKFGKWVAAQTDTRITGSDAFKQAVKYHGEVHTHGCDSWYAKEDNNREEAFRHFQLAYASYGKFTEALEKLKKVVASTGDTEVTELDKI